MTHPLFESAVNEIECAYARLGHQLGWRFLCVSAKNLAPSTSIALITANPGGNCIPEEHPSASCEQGSAYDVERWGTSAPGCHKLQVQVKALFNEIASASGLEPEQSPDLLNRSLVAYFIPFRSPRLKELHRLQESRTFANRLWADLFRHLNPKLIVTIDRQTHRDLRSILGRSKGAVLVSTKELPTGWGHYQATLDEYAIVDGEITLLRLPHLSTFQLFSSVRCSAYIREIMARACAPIWRVR